MSNNEIVDNLLDYLIKEDKRYGSIYIPNDYQGKRNLLRGVLNMRLPKPVSENIINLENELLQNELKEKTITNVNNIKLKDKHIGIWFGDITTLNIDAIVNAGNSALLGCFIPNHNCIDNIIHSNAGIKLRLACNKIMKNKEANVGDAIITKGYNLPSNYVIHTAGPNIIDVLKDEDIKGLENCYLNCLNLAMENNIKTIAFPCISTGLFSFPKDKASEIAVNTVKNYLNKYPNSFDKIIFNVFTREDELYYDRLFKD